MTSSHLFWAPQCDLAAQVYDEDQDPDAVLRDFASDTKAQGFRAVGVVQAGQCADSSLSAVLVHNGEKLLLAPVAVLAWHVAPDCASPPAFTSYSPRSAATGSACRCEGCGCKGGPAVSHANLTRDCGSPPSTPSTHEGKSVEKRLLRSATSHHGAW